MKNLIPSFLPTPRPALQEGPTEIPHARRIFPLRNLHFRDVKAVGFDMDYTLSHYRSPEIEDLAYQHSVRLLVAEKGYPAWLLDTRFDPAFAIRGLVLDGGRGNLLKLNSERQVVRASHGTRPLTREEIDATYERRRLISRGGSYRSIDTLFEIPECHLYAVLVDAAEAGRLPGKDPLLLFQDVRWAIDSAHRLGVMKAEILGNLDLFIIRDPDLPAALDRWKRAGKKLFVVSNSEWSFTQGVLSYLLDGQDPGRPLWTDYFDLVVVSARKPVFFLETPEPEPLPGQTAAYRGGNALWMEELLDARGEEILYVGDHIYGDILRSKKNVSWHTMLLIPELTATLEQFEEQAHELQEFMRLEADRRKSELRAGFLDNLLKRNREHRHLLSGRLSPEAMHALDLEAVQLRSERDARLEAAARDSARIAQLDERLEATFNRPWGSIFRDGYDQTRFADQIQTYACAYTGRISNLYMVDPSTALYAPVPTLPHEQA
ncbi:HAD-IG family 5'-nucleotidase [Mesoterricola sediminis]|uniref:Haloacid dehalogenase n=1 Tax=Mesoterricola sediminis TaxID=2927980 RepID=A0AA48KDV5_9BACT|nr:HAD-IG family 5'-nucleotidase [Mesoterricola sediminis]BDU78606.1 haloacid dehalogenase [Mesoterricola sediminis]